MNQGFYTPGSPAADRHAVLKVNENTTVLEIGHSSRLSHEHGGLDSAARRVLWRWEQGRAGRATSADAASMRDDTPGAWGNRLNTALHDVGRMLGHQFLGPALGQALVAELSKATVAGGFLHVGLEVDGADLVSLPWETITPPDHDVPLVLSAWVELYRTVTGLEAVPETAIPAPLRILVVIASPEHGGGELLDYEAELSRILDAVAPARTGHTEDASGKAYVRVLNWGSKTAIRQALSSERFHVLHVTCHATAGSLLLESDDGGPEYVDARAFVNDVLAPDRSVPLVVLAACSTAGVAPVSGGPSGAKWRSIAQDLLASGVPAVVAMTVPVTDDYATELLSTFYAQLAARHAGEPLAALAEARRLVEQARAALPGNDPRAALSEWATPTMFLRGPSRPLISMDASTASIAEPAHPSSAAQGIAVRDSGHFVGRRTELRRMFRALQYRSAAVIHGMGGVGKSTLARHVVLGLGRNAGMTVPLSGAATVDQIMLALADRLSSWSSTHDDGPDDARRQLIEVLRDGQRTWQERLTSMAEQLMAFAPVTLVLDDFEDNLIPAGSNRGHLLGDDSLAAFLATWPALPGSLLIITSRYIFPIPGDGRRWCHCHLGWLSPAESRKLLWRLPALDALPADEQRRAISDVGGHPRALEYLDAVMRAGNTRFADIADQVEQLWRRSGITDTQALFTELAAADFDSQLAEAINLAAHDVLLTDLLTHLETVPLARRLLVGASVYRQPVDQIGLMRQVSDENPRKENPEQERRDADLLRRHSSEVPNWRTLGSNRDPASIARSRSNLDEILRYFEDLRRPAETPGGFAQAMAALLDLGLLTPLLDVADRGGAGTPIAYYVHRWTAAAIARLVAPAELEEAHRQAIADYSLQVFPLLHALAFSPINHERVIYQIEAAYHQIHVGEPAEDFLGGALDRLHAWGMWAWEERVCRDTLASLPEQSELAAVLYRRIGAIKFDHGDLPAAERRYQLALAANEARGDDANQALDFHELGLVAQSRHDWAQAEALFRKAVDRFTEPDHDHDLVHTYNALGINATGQGQYAQAEEWFRKCIAVAERIQNRDLLASALHELGIIARIRGDHLAAERWHGESMNLWAPTGNRLSYARGLGELALLAKDQGDYPRAGGLLHRALQIFQDLGNRNDVALTYANLGALAGKMGDLASVEHWYTEAGAIGHEIGSPWVADLYEDLIRLTVRREDYRSAEKWARRCVDFYVRSGGSRELADACRVAASFCVVNGDLHWAIIYTVRRLQALPADTSFSEDDLELPRSVRSALGDDVFRLLLTDALSSNDSSWLLAILDAEEEARRRPGD